MTEENLFDAVDATRGIHKNRKQRRLQVRYSVGRQMKRNLFGWGRWRRRSALTTTPGRYEHPFAERDQG